MYPSALLNVGVDAEELAVIFPPADTLLVTNRGHGGTLGDGTKSCSANDCEELEGYEHIKKSNECGG